MRSNVLLLGAAIFVTCVAASPVWNPQFLSGGSGRNIRHLPCVSRRTGETGICMFAFACMKANGTHLGTCIDRFYFGSCCRMGDVNTDLGDLDHNTIFGSNNSEDNHIPILPPSSPITTTTESKYYISTFQSVQDNTIDVQDNKSPPPTTTSRSTTTTSRSTVTTPQSTTTITSIRPATTTTRRSTTLPTVTRTTTPKTTTRSTTQRITVTTTRSTSTTPRSTTPTTTTTTKRTTTPRSTPPSTTTWPTRYPTSTASTTKPPTKKPTPTRKPNTTTTKKPTRKPVVPSTTKKPVTSTKKPVLTTTEKTTTTPTITTTTTATTVTTTTQKLVTSAKTTTPKTTTVTTKPSSTTSSTPKTSTTTTTATTTRKPSKPTTTKPTPKPPPSKPPSKPTPTTTKTTTTPKPSRPWATKVPATTKQPPPKTTTAATTTTTTTSTLTTTTAPASLVTWTLVEEHHPTTESSEATSTEGTTGTTESWVLVPVTTHPPTGPSTDAPQSIGTTEVTTVSEVAPPSLTTLTPELQLNMSDYKQVCGRRLFPESRIVGGEKSTFGKWPWQISLRQWRTSTYLHKCGAALLNENWAITAAHCVENVPPSDLLLRLGEHDLSTEEEPYGYQERRVQIVASHPQFDPRTFEYDLALLRFYEPVTFQPNILPVCVPEDDTNFVGHTAFVTGWGRLYEDGPLPSVLQEVSVPVINNSVCETMYRSAGYIEHIPEIFICAGWRKGGFDSCEGDSGGPMVIQRPDKRWLLAGVISWGIGCAEPNQPGVYTRISEFREWINQILQF